MDLKEFKKYLEINITSLRTINEYYNSMTRFFTFSKEEISQEHINNFILDFKKRNKGQESINGFISALKKYCLFVNLSFTLPKIKTIKNKDYPYFTEEEFKNILKHIQLIFPENYKHKKDLMLLMFYTGLRPHEIEKFTKDNINLKNKEIIVKGKGNKTRYIPFLSNDLENMLKDLVNKDGYLFPFSNSCLNYMFRVNISNHFNLKHISAYTMRRSFAKFCAENGMDISYIQKLMGHESIQTTLKYVNPDSKMIHKKCEEIRRKNEN